MSAEFNGIEGIDPDTVVSLVASWGGVLRSDLFRRKREGRVPLVRGVAIYMLYEYGGSPGFAWSYPKVARHFNLTNHTTALYWHRRIGRMVANEPGFAAVVTDLRRRAQSLDEGWVGCAA